MAYFPVASLYAFTNAYALSDTFGKLIMFALFCLSTLCWVILTYKIWQTRKAKKSALYLQHLLRKKGDQWMQLETKEIFLPFPRQIPQPFARIYYDLKEKTLEMLQKKAFIIRQNASTSGHVYLSSSDIDLLQQHVSTTISSQHKILERNLFLLSTIASLAPFLGLLGTVWGILVTFAQLQTGGAMGSNSAILGGISTALATTVLGLVIAIPALVSYNYLRNHLKVFSSDMEDFLCTLLSTLELQYRKVDIH